MAVTIEVRVCRDLQDLCRQAAARTVKLVQDAVYRNGWCALVLAGGSTPKALYAFLARDYAGQIPWRQVHLFWGDERYVPHEDSGSNYRMVQESLLRHVSIPAANVHSMPTSFAEPEDAANAYEDTLKGYFDGPWPRFDLVLLGIGADGHTASLFPGSSAADEQERWVTAVETSADPPRRLTLTFRAINGAANVFFLAAGAAKADAVRCALREAPDLLECPAGGIRPKAGNLTWWLDAAASKFDEVSGSR